MTARSYTGIGTAPPAGGETDSLFNNVELLLMPEDGDATIDDKSSNARTVTNTGPVSIVSDVASPTGYAMDFGTEANLYYLTFSDDAGLKAGTGDFCIETIALSTNTTSGLGSMTGAGSGGSTGAELNFPWFYDTTTGPLGYPSAIDAGCNNSGVTSTNSGVTWNAGGYHHWAFTRSGTTTRVFCDGYEEVSGTSSYDIGSTYWTAFLLGMWSLPSLRVFAGKVAMFRLTIGAARYTSNFSPFNLFPKS
jgi:hypothetical protein